MMGKRLFVILSGLFALMSCMQVGPETPATEPVCEVEIVAAKDPETRALTLSGGRLNATWSVGDVVTVKKGSTTIGTLTAQSGGSTTTRLKGTLSGTLSVGNTLKLCYQTPEYATQNGTLSYIASNCDYAEATVTVSYSSGGMVETTNASFANKQSVNHFIFTDGTHSLSPSKVVISAASGKLVQRVNNGSNVFGDVTVNGSGSEKYVALHNTSGAKDTYTFVATVGSDTYIGRKSANLSDGKFYKATVVLTKRTFASVDLGLSVEWATCNIGSFYPEEAGTYFSWGETAPKSKYDASTYDYSTGISHLVGYWSYSDLPDESDAAVAIVNSAANPQPGEKWRMPTKAECEELVTNCTWTASTVNGRAVYVVKSKLNSKSIILPRAGRKFELANTDGLHYFGDEMTVWSKGCQGNGGSNQYYAYAIHLHSDNGYTPTVSVFDKPLGFNIRPVHVLPIPVSSVSLSQTSVRITKGSYHNLVATVLPENATDKSVTWRSSNTSVATVDSDGKVTAKAVGSATITVTTTDGGKTATCAVTVVNSSVVSGAVDLGLSVLWATSNVGASSSSAGGSIYRWAEITVSNGTEAFSSYKWWNNSTSKLTKYCCHATYGTVDNKTVIERADDAAYKVLGGNWRIPTRAEWQELVANTRKVSDDDGVMILESLVNGARITFAMPETYLDDGDRYARGRYWTSTLHGTYDKNAFAYKLDEGEAIEEIYPVRCSSLVIRPVCPY